MALVAHDAMVTDGYPPGDISNKNKISHGMCYRCAQEHAFQSLKQTLEEIRIIATGVSVTSWKDMPHIQRSVFIGTLRAAQAKLLKQLNELASAVTN